MIKFVWNIWRQHTVLTFTVPMKHYVLSVNQRK